MCLGQRLVMVFLMLEWCRVREVSTDARCNTDGWRVHCLLKNLDLQHYGPIELDFNIGQTETYPSCLQNNTEIKCVCHQRINSTTYQVQNTEMRKDGSFKIQCGNYSVTVQSQRKPSVPKLIAVQRDINAAKLYCSTDGNPKPTLEWYGNSKSLDGSNVSPYGNETILTKSLEVPNLKCCAINVLGKECSEVHHYDLNSKDDRNTDSMIFLKSGQSLLLRCKILSMSHPRLKWHFQGRVINSLTSGTLKVWMEYLSIQSVSLADSGEYVCKNNDNPGRKIRVEVFETDQINILRLKENIHILSRERSGFCLEVVVFSFPKAQCQWVRPDQMTVQCTETNVLQHNSTFQLCNLEAGRYQIKLRTDEKSLTRNISLCITDIPKITIFKDLSIITCKAQSSIPVNTSWSICPPDERCSDDAEWKQMPVNPDEVTETEHNCQRNITLTRTASTPENQQIRCCVTNSAGTHCSDRMLLQAKSNFEYVLYCSLIFLLLIVIFGFPALVKTKKPKYQPQIQMIQMGPNDNDYIYIDFRNFKYDPKWEFPRENLELGHQLGSGAFGMVVHATAYGISKPGVSVQVAVKMLKDKHQAVEKEALMDELKMLTHVGHHENIVNLLGACTGSGPVYLIFQYCCNGDLLNYLKINRERFHRSLRDALSGDRFRGLYHNFQQNRNSSGRFQPNGNLRLHDATVTVNEESGVFSESTLQRVCEHNQLLLNKEEELHSLTHDDLLSFSLQVAKGMEFLSSRNCIHRDLAARNVLVTGGRQVKIGDFGLARDIEHDSNYVIRGNVRLPVKWMAPESIFRGTYTVQSDVWAYGVLLWEIFSLGVTPYPGVRVDDAFYRMIDSGFHMEKPFYATESVYEVMCGCWEGDPVDRPSFSKLVRLMEKELLDVGEQLYRSAGERDDVIYRNTPEISDALERNTDPLHEETQ